jgi:SAM-dependent methyltransferase
MRLTDRLLEHPAVYATWQRPFVRKKFAPVERFLRNQRIRRVLDVGCGPGTNAPRFAGVDYVGVDINERYLDIARSRYSGRFVQADLETANLSSFGTFDAILVNSFLHHLSDGAVHRVLAQLDQLLEPQGRIHILELVLPERFSFETIMARLDRGKFARPLPVWDTLFSAHFDAAAVEPYSVAGLWAMVYFQGKRKSCASQ